MLDLSPARWIWFPSERTLPNTFVLFRRSVTLSQVPVTAHGYILADSRYRLTVNGVRVQWGPAPFDPRFPEADPVDLGPYLVKGENVIGVEVVHFGLGEGTWPFGKPGLIMQLEIDGQSFGTDEAWRCLLDRAHAPGRPKRWYLRALQDVFDARQHPSGWDSPGFDDGAWMDAMPLNCPPDRPSFSAIYDDYQNDAWAVDSSTMFIEPRSVPFMAESFVPAIPSIAHRVIWTRSPEDWFDFRTPGTFTTETIELPGAEIPVLPEGEAIAITFDLPEGMVGWPSFQIEASEGTIIELMTHEGHDPAIGAWMDTSFYCWSRFTCREGVNRFETFDFESAKSLQLHIRGHHRPIKLTEVGMRRRVYPWPHDPLIKTDDARLQHLWDASINTLNNSCQDTVVDGMARERQQYSGDCGHQLQAVRVALGDAKLPSRFLKTYAQGQFMDGVFCDSWPGYDRLVRLWQRQVGASGWGPIIDHSVGFCFDHYNHWMESGHLAPASRNWEAVLRFVDFLETSVQFDGMLPVENLGMNTVWIDHDAFRHQSEKRLSFNLYAITALRNALKPMAVALDRPADAERFEGLASLLFGSTYDAYYDPAQGTFVNNRPSGEAPRFDDRSLATTLLFDLLPDLSSTIEILDGRPENMGLSYPACANWRLWALAKAGRIQTVLDDLRRDWATMDSVVKNNTLQEPWIVKPNGKGILSHCPLAPLLVLIHGVIGLHPTAPGFASYEIRPQLGDLESLFMNLFTPQGEVQFEANSTQIQISGPTGGRVFWDGSTELLTTSQTLILPRR